MNLCICEFVTNVGNGNLARFWHSVEVVADRAVVVYIQPSVESFSVVVGEIDPLRAVVNGHGMEAIVSLYCQPVHLYWKSVCKRPVAELIRILVRISEQLLHVGLLMGRRVYSANQRFRLVG